MIAVAHTFFIFSKFLGNGGRYCFCVWQLATPPPHAQLHRSLQCCSLLNYYQWVWRDTCSLFPFTMSLVRVSLTLSLSLSPSHTHTHRQSAHIPSDMHLACVVQKTDEVYTARASVGPVVAFTRIFTPDRNHTPTQAQIYILPCMNALMSRAHTSTDASP